MSHSRDTLFCRNLLRETLVELKKHEPSLRPDNASFYIEGYKHSANGKRWATFDFNGFHWEGYADNAYDARAQAWDAYMVKRGYTQ